MDFYLYKYVKINIGGKNMKNIIFDLGGVILKETPIKRLKNIEINEYKELSKFFQNREKLDLGKDYIKKYR